MICLVSHGPYLIVDVFSDRLNRDKIYKKIGDSYIERKQSNHHRLKVFNDFSVSETLQSRTVSVWEGRRRKVTDFSKCFDQV